MIKQYRTFSKICFGRITILVHLAAFLIWIKNKRPPTFICGTPAVEPRSITSPSTSFTYCEFDFTDNFAFTSSKEGGVIDFNDFIDSLASIDSVTATDSNSGYNPASDIDRISSSEKFGVTTSVLSITVSVLTKFPARTPLKRFIQNSHRMVLKEIPIPAWPILGDSSAYDLSKKFQFPESSVIWLGDKICSQDSSVPLPDYFQYCLF